VVKKLFCHLEVDIFVGFYVGIRQVLQCGSSSTLFGLETMRSRCHHISALIQPRLLCTTLASADRDLLDGTGRDRFGTLSLEKHPSIPPPPL
jgi:hypothetical protein